MLAFYAEQRGGKAILWVNLLSVNEHFEGKHNNQRAFQSPALSYFVAGVKLFDEPPVTVPPTL